MQYNNNKDLLNAPIFSSAINVHLLPIQSHSLFRNTLINLFNFNSFVSNSLISNPLNTYSLIAQSPSSTYLLTSTSTINANGDTLQDVTQYTTNGSNNDRDNKNNNNINKLETLPYNIKIFRLTVHLIKNFSDNTPPKYRWHKTLKEINECKLNLLQVNHIEENNW